MKSKILSTFHFPLSTYREGQSIVEILIGLGIGVLIIGAVATILSANLKTSLSVKTTQIVSSFSQELLDLAKSSAESDWHNIYNLSKGASAHYHISSSTQAVIADLEIIIADGKEFGRYFYVENVSRDQCGIGAVTESEITTCTAGPGTSGVADDPSTQKVTVIIENNNGQTVLSQYQYITRSRNYSFNQNDWSGGSGQNGVIIGPNSRFSTSTGIINTGGNIQLQLPL